MQEGCSNEKHYRKCISQNSHNANNVAADPIAYNASKTKIAYKKDNGRSQDHQKDNIILKSIGCCLLLFLF